MQFPPYYYFRFKIWRHIWIQRARCINTQSFRAWDTIFGDFCDDNVCAYSKYINSTSGREYLAENGFSDNCDIGVL